MRSRARARLHGARSPRLPLTKLLSFSDKYRKPKPWDTDDIDHWKVLEWTPASMPAPLLEESSFATLYPQ